MSHPNPNWFYAEVAALADRFARAAKDARDKMGAPCALADASVHISDDGRELVVEGDVAGYTVAATSPWGFDADLSDDARMLIRGLCEKRANSRDAGCRLIRIIPHTTERRAAA